MTKEEILAMEAGEKLDSLVHEDVMEKKRPWIYDKIWYSRDISAAWQVVEKFLEDKEHEWSWSIEVYKNEAVAGVTCPLGHNTSNWHGIRTVEAKDLPEAICKAALLTKLAG